MVTGAEVREIARRNFEEAKTRKPADLAAARTVSETLDIEENYEKAMAAYLRSLIQGFEAASGEWKALRDEAETAEKELIEARKKAENLAATITAMGKLTGAVTKLVKAVK